MNWNILKSVDDLDAIDAESVIQTVLLLKHSTTCSISATALARLERGWKQESSIKPYYLDLLSYRAISNAIADRYGVEHQSPQVLIIQNGKCVFTESHLGINVNEIESFA